MQTDRTCPSCGQQVPRSIGECLYCSPSEVESARRLRDAAPQPPAAEPPAAPAGAPAAAAEPSGDAAVAEFSFAQLMMKAEALLARGSAERALVLASRVVSRRPESLPARALYHRARRELLSGARGQRLEQRVAEARRLLQGGDLDGAERIVRSVLKVVPEHATARQLRGRLGGLPEAEAERELARLGRSQAEQAVAAARAALQAGAERRALLAVRRGLRLAPDHPELVALLRRLEASGGRPDAAAPAPQPAPTGAAPAAGRDEVRSALGMLAAGRLEDSLRLLRDVLRRDPDDVAAQAAVQDVRRAWLARAAASPPAVPVPPAEPPALESLWADLLPPEKPRAAPPAPAASEPAEVRAPSAPPAAWPRYSPAGRELIAVSPRRRATPLAAVVAAAAFVFTVLILTTRPSFRAARPAPSAPPVTQEVVETYTPEASGPLSAVDPLLREAVEIALADYARALEAQDAQRLARARPDLTAAERNRMLAQYADAINVATDIRVVDVVPEGDRARVAVLRTDVIVGPSGRTAPVEELLVFERHPDGWGLAHAEGR